MLAWRRSGVYPLVTLVALVAQSQTAALTGIEAYWQDSRGHAILAMLGLLAAAGAASLLSAYAPRRARERRNPARLPYRHRKRPGRLLRGCPLRDRKNRIADFRIVDCNERGAFFYGVTRAQLLGRLASCTGGVDGADLIANYRRAMAIGFHQENRRMPADSRLTIRWRDRRIVRVGDGPRRRCGTSASARNTRRSWRGRPTRTARPDGRTATGS